MNFDLSVKNQVQDLTYRCTSIFCVLSATSSTLKSLKTENIKFRGHKISLKRRNIENSQPKTLEDTYCDDILEYVTITDDETIKK
jgi:hypothetical protein